MQEGTKDGNSDYGSRARHATGLASDLDHGGVLESPEVCSDVCIMQQSLGWSRHLCSRVSNVLIRVAKLSCQIGMRTTCWPFTLPRFVCARDCGMVRAKNDQSRQTCHHIFATGIRTSMPTSAPTTLY